MSAAITWDDLDEQSRRQVLGLAKAGLDAVRRLVSPKQPEAMNPVEALVLFVAAGRTHLMDLGYSLGEIDQMIASGGRASASQAGLRAGQAQTLSRDADGQSASARSAGKNNAKAEAALRGAADVADALARDVAEMGSATPAGAGGSEGDKGAASLRSATGTPAPQGETAERRSLGEQEWGDAPSKVRYAGSPAPTESAAARTTAARKPVAAGTAPASPPSTVEFVAGSAPGYPLRVQLVSPEGGVVKTLSARGPEEDVRQWMNQVISRLPGFGWTLAGISGNVIARHHPKGQKAATGETQAPAG